VKVIYAGTTIAARGKRRRRALSEAHETALVVFFSAISQCRAALFD
jgi:hypothetical protein